MADLADAFVAIPGGFGTVEEAFETLTWTQLGLHEKPTGFLNVLGYFTDLAAFLDRAVDEGFSSGRAPSAGAHRDRGAGTPRLPRGVRAGCHREMDRPPDAIAGRASQTDKPPARQASRRRSPWRCMSIVSARSRAFASRAGSGASRRSDGSSSMSSKTMAASPT
jgi:hypothetical protein